MIIKLRALWLLLLIPVHPSMVPGVWERAEKMRMLGAKQERGTYKIAAH